MIEAHATAKYIRSSAQKAGLVMDLIRGRSVDEAFATLQFTRKVVAHDIEKVLRSAVANAQHKEGFGGDVDRLIVSACYANQGPSLKRVRPAPMGRAFRILKRTTHLTVRVSELPRRELVSSEPATSPSAGDEAARKSSPKTATRKTATKRKTVKRKTAKRKTAKRTTAAKASGSGAAAPKKRSARKTAPTKKS